MSSQFAPVARPVVLLIEDDEAVRRALHLLLVAHGYDVLAFSRTGGVAAMSEVRYAACLVADLAVPDGDGLDLLHDLRARGWSGPAILISGHLTDAVRARAVAEGYDAALPKPIGEAVLVNTIARLLAAAPGGQT